MSAIVEKMKQIPDLCAISGCTDEQLNEAQRELDMLFPEEYIDYVKEFGCIDFGSVEWTGLNIKGRLNTVTATKREISVNPDFPKSCFVLEDLAIDGKLVIVDQKGSVYLLQHSQKEYLCDSISEYLEMCIERNKD